ncbi:MAG: hypothetical protein ACXWEY_16020 [Bacteroidia bacterium]
MKKIKAFYKLILSYFKKQWNFEDYPLEIWINKNAEQEEIKYVASLTNWSLFIERGETLEIAKQKLKDKFLAYRKDNSKIPRPGSFVPIQYASTVEIEKYENVAVDFFNRIIEIDYDSCFISDESSLYDFGFEKEEAFRKIKSEYNIEPNESLVLHQIFKQIHFASA